MKNLIKNIYLRNFFSSKDYWENRYRRGGNSGAGSYNVRAKYKAKILNNIIKKYSIKNLIEFGCGDGNNLSYYKIDYYTGLDVSPTAIKKCINKFRNDKTKSFIWYDSLYFKSGGFKAELVISFEVIFHLIENDLFKKYMDDLFNTSSKYVLICSTNDDQIKDNAKHVKHRKFTDFVPKEFSLIKHIQTPKEGDLKGFMSDFYLFSKEFYENTSY